MHGQKGHLYFTVSRPRRESFQERHPRLWNVLWGVAFLYIAGGLVAGTIGFFRIMMRTSG